MKTDAYKTVSLRPYTYLTSDINTRLWFTFSLLMVQCVLLLFTRSWASILLIVVSCASCSLAQATRLIREKLSLFDWLTAVTRGLTIGLLLPSAYHPLTVFFVVFFLMLVCQWILGGFADCWVNPVALSVSFLWILGATYFPDFNLNVEILQNKNPLLSLIQNGTYPQLSFDSSVTSFFNKTIFRWFNVSIPDGYVSLLIDSHASIPAFRFNLVTLLSSVVMISFDLVSPIIPGIYLLVYTILVYLFAPLFYGGLLAQGDILMALLTSGTLFTTLYLLQLWGTVPITLLGKIFYASLAGIVAFLIVGCGQSPVGSVFTILVVNVMSPVIGLVETAFEKNYLVRSLLPRTEALREGSHA